MYECQGNPLARVTLNSTRFTLPACKQGLSVEEMPGIVPMYFNKEVVLNF